MKDKPTVLLVEDNYMNKVLVKEILTLNGYEIVEAKTGTEAIKLVNEAKPDIILMDLQIPEMDGVTATRIIKADESNRAIPILALTASGMKGDEDDITKKGFDGFVAKPIDVKKLLAALEEGLHKRVEDKG